MIDALDKSNCKVFGTHRHVYKKEEGKFPRGESHLHFMCEDKDSEDAIRVINFLKNY